MNKRNLQYTTAFLLWIAILIFAAGCKTTALEAGGAYHDPLLAKTDQAILDGAAALQGFVDWQTANAAFLAKYQEVGALAGEIRSHKDAWETEAWNARDAYAQAKKAYDDAVAAGQTGDQAAVTASQAKLAGALAVIQNITQQIAQYRAAHPTGS
jgi:hypothetical protein